MELPMTQREVDAKIEQSADVAAAETETDTVVADYLCRHPDFFVRHPDVLRMMAPPNRWSDDGVVDMQRYLVERHRGEIDDLRNCAQEVIETSRSNLSTQTRTHAAVLSLLNVTDIDALVLTATDDWPLSASSRLRPAGCCRSPVLLASYLPVPLTKCWSPSKMSAWSTR